MTSFVWQHGGGIAFSQLARVETSSRVMPVPLDDHYRANLRTHLPRGVATKTTNGAVIKDHAGLLKKVRGGMSRRILCMSFLTKSSDVRVIPPY